VGGGESPKGPKVFFVFPPPQSPVFLVAPTGNKGGGHTHSVFWGGKRKVGLLTPPGEKKQKEPKVFKKPEIQGFTPRKRRGKRPKNPKTKKHPLQQHQKKGKKNN